MSVLLHEPPYSPRNEETLLRELASLCEHHRRGCLEYARIWPAPTRICSVEDVPYLHAGLFKRLSLRTADSAIRHQRTLFSSSTSGAEASQVALDERSSALHSQSSTAILSEFTGPEKRPLVILDSAASLRQAGVSARIAAAMSLRPLASEFRFLLQNAEDPKSVKWDVLAQLLERHDSLLVYGFTWMLWLAWGQGEIPNTVQRALAKTRVHFIHSGGWKKLEERSIDRARLDEVLLSTVAEHSAVIDYYGLVEQVGVVYPLCEAGFRHPPRWADVVVRNPHSLEPRVEEAGLLQLLNTLAWGAPYHSVLTEDLGFITPGPCDCGRSGRRFTLLGRVPQSELRGCANV